MECFVRFDCILFYDKEGDVLNNVLPKEDIKGNIIVDMFKVNSFLYTFSSFNDEVVKGVKILDNDKLYDVGFLLIDYPLFHNIFNKILSMKAQNNNSVGIKPIDKILDFDTFLEKIKDYGY
jgi:hypothetical protein